MFYTPFRNVADPQTPARPLSKSSKHVANNPPGGNPTGQLPGSVLRRQHAEAQQLIEDAVRPVDVNDALLTE